jgi:hypothetical protein
MVYRIPTNKVVMVSKVVKLEETGLIDESLLSSEVTVCLSRKERSELQRLEADFFILYDGRYVVLRKISYRWYLIPFVSKYQSQFEQVYQHLMHVSDIDIVNNPKPKITKIIIFKQKHGSIIYDASTDELVYAACLEQLTLQWDNGIHAWKNEYVPSGYEKPFHSKNEIESWPDSSIKDFALKDWEKYKRESLHIQHYQEEYDHIQDAVKSKNGRKAKDIFEQYINGFDGYNGFDIQALSVAGEW